jgi:hypothetical protein
MRLSLHVTFAMSLPSFGESSGFRLHARVDKVDSSLVTVYQSHATGVVEP